jgi:ATP/maltotriose-dependent transcriptional regulator MalT
MERELVAPVDIPAIDLQDAAAGDVSAFARIVTEHHDHMARVCFVICGDLDMAQDAVQAAWPIAWRKLASLRVAQGRTDRQIAAELFITEKTAGVHVSHILDKLGASGRTEAAAIARRLGLVD